MQKIHLLLVLAGAACLCGCDKETQVKTQKIDVLTQKIFILQQSQARQLAAIESQLAALPPFLEKLENNYYVRSQDRALFYQTNTLYFLLTMDKKIQAQFQLADAAHKASDALAYYYHTNQTDTAYFCAGQIADAMDAQEKRIEDAVNAETRRASSTLGDTVAAQIKSLSPDPAQVKAEAARRMEMAARLDQIQRELDQIKALLKSTNSPALRP